MMGMVVHVHPYWLHLSNRCARIFDRLTLSATRLRLCLLAIILADVGSLHAQSQPVQRLATPRDVIVTIDNFRRAETDRILGDLVGRNGLGRFVHQREFPAIDLPTVYPNRDTLLSMAVFDLDAGPVTITLPNADARFIAMYVVDEDQYISAVYYSAGSYALAKEQIGTRYVYVGVRVLVDPSDVRDVKAAYALQDAIQVEQKGGPGTFQAPRFDPVSRIKVGDALFALGSTLTSTQRMFGARDEVDPVRHLIGTAIAFGGVPDKEVLTLKVTPRKNNGMDIYKLIVNNAPVNGFWSVSVYNAEGYFVKNLLDAYTVNNITAKKGSDGSVAVQFGGCNGDVANCLPTPSGWKYVVRLYRPRPEILDGTWIFPEAQPLR
jgi:hypothetical protein